MAKRRQDSEKSLTVRGFLYEENGIDKLIVGKDGLMEKTKDIPLACWEKVKGESASGNEQELRYFRLTKLIEGIWGDVKNLYSSSPLRPKEMEWFQMTMTILFKVIDEYKKKDIGVPLRKFAPRGIVKKRLRGKMREIRNKHAPLGHNDQFLWNAIDSVKQKLGSFKLTELSVEKLRGKGVSDEILEGLQPLVDHEITGENNFVNVIEKQIGSEQTNKYKKLILKKAKKKKKDDITPDDPEAVEMLAHPDLLGCSEERAKQYLLAPFGKGGVEQYDGNDHPKADSKIFSPEEEMARGEVMHYCMECIASLEKPFRSLFYRHKVDEIPLTDLHPKHPNASKAEIRALQRRCKKEFEYVKQRFYERYDDSEIFSLCLENLHKYS